jgi:hypothetical protein
MASNRMDLAEERKDAYSLIFRLKAIIYHNARDDYEY